MIPARSYLLVFACLLAVPHHALALLPSDTLAQYGRQSWQTGSGLPQNTITALAQTPDGFLWVGTEAGLARFDGYSFLVPTELQGKAVRKLWTVDGKLHIQTAESVLQLIDGTFHSGSEPPPATVQQLPENLHLNASCTLLDRQGALWIGTDRGLLRFIHGDLQPFSSNDLLSGAEILSLFEDTQGNLWVGTADSGLQLVKEQRFTTYTSERIRAVLQDSRGTWLGSDGNGLLHLQNGQVIRQSGLSSDVVLSLASTARGLLVGTPDGLNTLGLPAPFTSANGLPDDFIRSLFVDTDGSTWVGTRHGLAHIVNAAVTTYTQSNGLGSDIVGAITRDKSANLWVATLNGLSRLHGSIFTTYTVADGLSSNIITDLYPDTQGDLWIATQGGGLNRFRDDMFTRATPRQGVPATLYGVTDDDHGSLWLAAQTGIYRLQKDEFNRLAHAPDSKVTVVSYGTSDGLRIAESRGGGHPAVFKDRTGGIWFATERGAAFLSPQHAGMPDPLPQIALETVSIDDTAFSPFSLADIPPGRPRLAFQYAGLDFANPQRVRYRYRLEGFDDEWIEAGARRTAFYTNLGPGQYTFRVLAGNGAGQWSATAAVVTFRVLPHFYQAWWFRLLLGVCSLLLISGVLRWRIRRVRTEFRAVLNERTRIAREIHDTLAQGFAGISVQLELVSRLLTSAPEKARHHLDEARLLARNCIDDARRTIWDLRNTEAADLPARLSKLARDAAQGSGLPVQFHVRGTYRPLPAKVEDEIARIAQEALTNAVRHSGASAIQANLIFEGNQVRLAVSDDGCGMKIEPGHIGSPNGHYGLTGMRERAESIGAVLSIASQEGSGTTVEVEAPIR